MACHRPIPTIHGLWPVKEATCGQLPIRSRDMLHTSNAIFEPSRWDPRMVKPDWAIAASYEPARALPLRRRESRGARRPVPIGGRWRFAVAGRHRPATHARACVASSWRCWSDRRLRVRAPARRISVGVGARRPGAGWRASGLRPFGVRVRRAARGGVTVVGAEWRLLRRGLTTPATRRKPGRGSVLPRVGGGYVPWDRLPPCRVRFAARAGWPSSLPGGAYLVGVWLPQRRGESRDAGPGLSARGHPVSSCSCTG